MPNSDLQGESHLAQITLTGRSTTSRVAAKVETRAAERFRWVSKLVRGPTTALSLEGVVLPNWRNIQG